MSNSNPMVPRAARKLLSISLLLLLFMTYSLYAQVAGTGTIQGTVSDPTGAVLANAPVTIANPSTNLTLTGKTDGSGIYVFPNIAIGTYTVTVTAKGFETYVSTGNVLEVGSSISINVTMTVGAESQRVEVKAVGLALQTEDVTYKQTIDSTQMMEMPLNGSSGRQMTSLLSYTGGVIAGGGNDSTGSKYSYAAVGESVGGSMGNATLWRLDGADNGDYMAGANLPFPFPDAVNQFSAEISTLGAGDGGHAGGMVNVVTKSGTNKFHGDAFELIRNNVLDATSFYVLPCLNGVHPGPTCGKDTLHQDDLGGTIGGPVWIPKVYNGKDKLFFFAGYQFHRYKNTTANTFAYVPTAANLAGNYTVEAGTPTSVPGAGPTTGVAPNSICSSKLTQLVDPITGIPVPGNVYTTAPTPNPVSKALLAYLPPVVPLADGSDICGHVQYSIPSQNFDKQFVTRVDYTINAKNHLYGRYFLDSYQLPAFFSPTNILLTTQSGNPEQRVQTETIGEDHTFTANLVNSAHIAVLRRVNLRGYSLADNVTGCSLGAAMTCGLPAGLYLSTGGSNLGGFSMGGGTNSLSHFNDNTLVIDDDATYLHGRHQIVFGGEFVRNQLNISNGYTSNGQFSFGSNYSSYGPYGQQTQSPYNGNYCASCSSQPTQYGSGALDFLEGTMSGFTQSKQQQNAMRGPVPSLYVQDTFHATKQLTIVAGLRWSPFYMPYDVKNRGNGPFSLSAFLANQHSSVYPNAPAGMFFYGDPGVPRSFTASSPNQWDPNVGFTYDLSGDGKTVLRGGAEYIYDFPNNFTTERNQNDPPFATAVSSGFNTYVPFNSPWAPPTGYPLGPAQPSTAITSNPFAAAGAFAGVPAPGCTPVGVPPCAVFPAGGQFMMPDAKFHPAVYAQWTASLQHDFSKGWMASLQYMGSKGSHEAWAYGINNPVFIPGVSSGVAGPTNCNVSIGGVNYYLGEPGTAAVPKAGVLCSTTGGSEANRATLVLQNPSQGALIGWQGNGNGTPSILISDTAFSTYEGMVLTVQHRFASNFNVLANYTYSKCLDEVDNNGEESGVYGEVNYNPRLDYGPCGFDYRNILNVTLVVKSAFHFSNHVEDLVLNGWEFGGVSTIHTGSNFNVTVGDYDLVGAPGGDRASTIPGVKVYQKVQFRQATGQSNRQYLNPAAFQTSMTYYNAWQTATATGPVYGNMGRNEFHLPPVVNFDGQVSRFWKLHEGLSMDTRIEAFNLLNHPSFGGLSSSTVTSGTFGQIGSTSNGARVFQGDLKFIF